MLVRGKYSSLFDPFVSYTINEVFWIRTQWSIYAKVNNVYKAREKWSQIVNSYYFFDARAIALPNLA